MRKSALCTLGLFLLLSGVAGARQDNPDRSTATGEAGKQPTNLPGMDGPRTAHDGYADQGGAFDNCDQCEPEGPCGPPGRFWASAEYLLWWTKADRVPPLITSGTTSSAGIVGRNGTVILLGDSGLDNAARSGGRFDVGFWLNDCHTFGVEAGYFFLEDRPKDFAFAGTGAPGSAVLARPFFNVITQAPDSEIDSFPGVASGQKLVHTSSFLQGAEANAICNLCCCGNWCGCGGYRVDLLGGFRYLQLDEDLEILESLSVFPNVPVIGGSSFNIFDQFKTRNHFYGGQIGARGEIYRSGFFVDVIGKVALGGIDSDIDVNGSTQIMRPGVPTTVAQGGLLAQTTNIGHFERDDFAVVPEFTINFGYQVTCHLRAYVGYTFLYCSSVFRPGDQIDVELNPTRFPTSPPTTTPPVGPARPAPILRDTDFWAQGLNFGLELRY
jgi:hypothetical protein